jgi:hypothetical protein
VEAIIAYRAARRMARVHRAPAAKQRGLTLARQADGALRPSDLEKSRVRNPYLLLNYT